MVGIACRRPTVARRRLRRWRLRCRGWFACHRPATSCRSSSRRWLADLRWSFIHRSTRPAASPPDCGRPATRRRVHPEQWARAAGGVDVVIGGRSAVWAPCAGMRSIVVLDEHDEALQEERSPTWHARDVAIERARRAGVPVRAGLAVSVGGRALQWAGDSFRRPSVTEERDGWPILELVDRTGEEPWKRSLLTSPLIQHLRNPDQRVICVHNTKGRARLLACRTCKSLQRCEKCQAAVMQDDTGSLVCRRCGTVAARRLPELRLRRAVADSTRRQPAARGDRGRRRPTGRDGHRRQRDRCRTATC